MAAGDFSFRFTGVMPRGWTAQTIAPTPRPSVVGPVNGAAQNPVTAAALETTPSTLSDASLGSRRYANPNTGNRTVAARASVYAMQDAPAYLTQAVNDLNSEQALRRSLQAEWNNRLLANAQSGGPDAYLWLEALRAASVGPGSSVSFGQAIQNPMIGKSAFTQAVATNTIKQTAAANIAAGNWAQQKLALLKAQPWPTTSSGAMERSQEISQLESQVSQATRAAGSLNQNGWT